MCPLSQTRPAPAPIFLVWRSRFPLDSLPHSPLSSPRTRGIERATRNSKGHREILNDHDMTDAVFNADRLHEGIDLEAKRAAGRDGRGELPEEIWETYSAFANTRGGSILLGVSEEYEDEFEATGIEEPDRVLRDFWAQVNDPRKVSRNLLTSESITRHPTGNGSWVIEITVPRASREERPVFIGGDPITGTYKRLHEADLHCTEDEVKRMLAEQSDENTPDSSQRNVN